MLKTTLFARWIVMNAFIAACFVVGSYYGLLQQFLTDETYMTQSIFVAVLFLLATSGFTSYSFTQQWKNIAHRSSEYRIAVSEGKTSDFKDELAEEYARYLALHRLAGPLMVALGLLGTVVGISLAFAQVNPEVISDVSASQAVMATLLSGLATAFHTRFVGIVGMIWNMLNLHMLTQTSSKLFSTIISEG